MTATLLQDKIIQIRLFEYQHLTTKKWLFRMGLGWLLLISLSSIAYWYFRINLLFLLLGCGLLGVLVPLIFSQSKYSSSAEGATLIIAFGEVQLMKNQHILWCEKLEDLDISYHKYSNYQIPILVIKGRAFSKISIGYGSPKTPHIKQELDYLIFSKLNWTILNQFTKMTTTEVFKNDKIPAIPLNNL